MGIMRAWKYRLYPSKTQQKEFDRYLQECKNLWNSLLEYAKTFYGETGMFPTRKRLYLKAKETAVFSQVAQNVADRLAKSLGGVLARKKSGINAGFPRFKPIERMKSFTYPQFGFRLGGKLELSGIGSIPIKKHRDAIGKLKTLTIKRSPSGKWFAAFTSEMKETAITRKAGPAAGVDLGIEHFAYLSDGTAIENPRHLKQAEENLIVAQRRLSRKMRNSKNRRKAGLKVALTHEKLTNKRRDFLHKTSRWLVNAYSFLAFENLNVAGLAKGFLAKSVLDCSWAEFTDMLAYKAAEAGCEIMLVDPAYTSQRCSNCGFARKKSLAERWHVCPCGASMHRDLNAAINILNRATSGTGGNYACGEETTTGYKHDWQVSSLKQDAHGVSRG
jgi:putative transposase